MQMQTIFSPETTAYTCGSHHQLKHVFTPQIKVESDRPDQHGLAINNNCTLDRLAPFADMHAAAVQLGAHNESLRLVRSCGPYVLQWWPMNIRRLTSHYRAASTL
ncbi:hypothetical protein ABZP36_025091 [Zizania latifolia]